MASVYDVEALPYQFHLLFQLLTSFDSSLTDADKMLSFRAMVTDVSVGDVRWSLLNVLDRFYRPFVGPIPAEKVPFTTKILGFIEKMTSVMIDILVFYL